VRSAGRLHYGLYLTFSPTRPHWPNLLSVPLLF
jgi:hypothetical protein